MIFSPRFKRLESYIYSLQNQICQAIDKINKESYIEDLWNRKEGGGGITRIYTQGLFLEKGGVNVSSIHGELGKEISKKIGIKAGNFSACGLSLVLHPYSPRIPTVHFNIRYFEQAQGDAWYGGGIDLTPFVPLTDDFFHFHRQVRACCERSIPGSYNQFKPLCDNYFTLPHRGEMRGIGGVFFDYLKDNLDEKENLVKSLGDGFEKIYLPIVKKRLTENFTQEEKKFQLLRRGRYVEFNLIYDRGTLFGFKTGGRIESILMSLPPTLEFPYNWQPKHPFEKEMLSYFKPRDWVDGL